MRPPLLTPSPPLTPPLPLPTQQEHRCTLPSNSHPFTLQAVSALSLFVFLSFYYFLIHSLTFSLFLLLSHFLTHYFSFSFSHSHFFSLTLSPTFSLTLYRFLSLSHSLSFTPSLSMFAKMFLLLSDIMFSVFFKIKDKHISSNVLMDMKDFFSFFLFLRSIYFLREYIVAIIMQISTIFCSLYSIDTAAVVRH